MRKLAGEQVDPSRKCVSTCSLLSPQHGLSEVYLALEILREIAGYVATFRPLNKHDRSLHALSQVSKDWRAACLPFRFRVSCAGDA